MYTTKESTGAAFNLLPHHCLKTVAQTPTECTRVLNISAVDIRVGMRMPPSNLTSACLHLTHCSEILSPRIADQACHCVYERHCLKPATQHAIAIAHKGPSCRHPHAGELFYLGAKQFPWEAPCGVHKRARGQVPAGPPSVLLLEMGLVWHGMGRIQGDSYDDLYDGRISWRGVLLFHQSPFHQYSLRKGHKVRKMGNLWRIVWATALDFHPDHCNSTPYHQNQAIIAKQATNIRFQWSIPPHCPVCGNQPEPHPSSLWLASCPPGLMQS